MGVICYSHCPIWKLETNYGYLWGLDMVVRFLFFRLYISELLIALELFLGWHKEVGIKYKTHSPIAHRHRDPCTGSSVLDGEFTGTSQSAIFTPRLHAALKQLVIGST